jgi:hypothetical protein
MILLGPFTCGDGGGGGDGGYHLPSLSLSSLSLALENVFPSPLPKRSISKAAKDLTDFDFLSSLCLCLSLYQCSFIIVCRVKHKGPRTKGSFWECEPCARHELLVWGPEFPQS